MDKIRSKPIVFERAIGRNSRKFNKAAQNAKAQAVLLGHKPVDGVFFHHKIQYFNDVKIRCEKFSFKCARCRNHIRFTMYFGELEYHCVDTVRPCRAVWMMR